MRLINPEGLLPPVGYSHVVLPGPGTPIYLAGQTGNLEDGSLPDGLVAQFAAACRNVGLALAAADASPTDVVSIQIYVTDMAEYRSRLKELGEGYREVFGRHYPAMALIGARELFDPNALVELVAVGFRPTDR